MYAIRSYYEIVDSCRNRVDFGAGQKFPVSAKDLMPALEGAALGTRLAELESRWIKSGFSLSRDELLA